MHIAQLLHSFKIGGSEVLAENLAKGLYGKGLQCSYWGMTGEGGLRQRLRDCGIATVSFDCPAGVSLRCMIQIALAMKRQEVDLVVTHHFRQLFHAVPAALLTSTTLVHVEHDFHFYTKGSRYLPTLRKLLRFVSGFVVVSKELATEFENGLDFTVSCIAIPNGVDTERFKKREDIRLKMREQHNFDPENLVIGTCCRLEPVKQLDLLLNGFACYLKRNDKARLVIVGEGSLSDDMIRLAKDLGVYQQTTFAGARSNIDEYLNMFDIFTLTSANEGLPLSILEAMSVGLPIVSTDVGAISSVVGNSNGILLQEHTPVAIADALERLVAADARNPLGISARRLVKEKYSQDLMVDAYHQVLTRKMHSPLTCFLKKTRFSS